MAPLLVPALAHKPVSHQQTSSAAERKHKQHEKKTPAEVINLLDPLFILNNANQSVLSWVKPARVCYSFPLLVLGYDKLNFRKGEIWK